jgi:hypothetical protein
VWFLFSFSFPNICKNDYLLIAKAKNKRIVCLKGLQLFRIVQFKLGAKHLAQFFARRGNANIQDFIFEVKELHWE